MYIREVTSSRKHGPDAVYLQLVEGHRDSKTGKVQTQILHSFGRKDQLDLGQIYRLANQLAGYLKPEDQPDLLSGLEITHSWDYGGPYLLEALWRELEFDRFFLEALTERATVLKTKQLNADERSFLKRCGVAAPPRIVKIT